MASRGRILGSIVVALALVRIAAAEPSAVERSAPIATAPRHAVYVELLGKGGLWGAGYDFAITRRFAVGGVASYYVLGGDRYLTLAPYLAAAPVIRGPHRWFVHLGPQIVRRSTPSPVPEWDGMSSTAVGAELSSGYEYRRGVLVRIYALAEVGDRFTPGVGISLGWSR